MKRGRKTKIVATLGPASSSPEQLKALFAAGADVFRINMSHTSHERLAELHAAVRALEEQQGRPIAILVDLQGPKIRVGSLLGGHLALKVGDRIRLVREAVSTETMVLPIPHTEVFAALKQKHCLMIDDGKIRLRTFA
ncbi:MAG TPA: pyruvate kinase, partial [Rhizomicrobium sp.]|nr:pyruvate kinase [Rhizomicrobium sp.]